MINYIKLVMEQKWYSDSEMDQTQLIELKSHHITQLTLILVVIIIFMQRMCPKFFQSHLSLNKNT